jgi:RNA polymerase sigma-70 factor (ECF subfamily)
MADTSSDPSPLRETRFIAGIHASELHIFEEFYRTHFEDVCRYVATVVNDEDAVDVAQDVFLSIWNIRQDLPVHTDRELFYYLLRASRNRALKIVRHDRVRDAHDHALEIETRTSAQGIDDTDEHDRLALVPQITQLIDQLPARSREVLLLRWYHGLGFKEIATLMGISYGSVHVLHSRAMAMMKDRLGVL